jgi:F-type H+-transporting ATPase subunit delta
MIRRFARPYASAIFDVAGSPEKANEVREELARFEAARVSANDLRDLYANPAVENEVKVNVTKTIADRLGLSALSKKVLEVLLNNHRMNDLGAIVFALAAIVNEKLSIVVADVTAAHVLSEAEVAELRRTLETRVGKKVELRLKTDPSLLGGFIAQIGSEIWDASVTGKIHKFRATLA